MYLEKKLRNLVDLLIRLLVLFVIVSTECDDNDNNDKTYKQSNQ